VYSVQAMLPTHCACRAQCVCHPSGAHAGEPEARRIHPHWAYYWDRDHADDEEDEKGAGIARVLDYQKEVKPKYVAYGCFAVNVQKLNAHPPQLSVTYLENDQRVTYFSNRVLSPLAREAIKNLLRNHTTTFEEQFMRLETTMKVLITDFIERSRVGKLRHRGPNRVKGEGLAAESSRPTVAPKIIAGRGVHLSTPVEVSVRDPKDRLMILLGSLNARDNLNESERAEAIMIAQELPNTGRLNQKELQKVSEALEE